MRDLFMKFRKSEDGTTLIEYGVALIVAIIVGGTALVTLADNTSINMDTACGSLVTTAAAYTCP